MVANVGRTIGVYTGEPMAEVLVAGVRQKSANHAGEPVDITNDDSSGWRQVLDTPTVNQVDIPVSGVLVNDVLRAEWYSGTRLKRRVFVYPDGGELSGMFYLNGYNETGEHDGEITFEATFISSGVVTYKPAPESSS